MTDYKAAEEALEKLFSDKNPHFNVAHHLQARFLTEHRDTILSALRAMQERRARNQPCGCIICYCDDEIQCHGCGAKSCGKDDCVFKVGGVVMDIASARSTHNERD